MYLGPQSSQSVPVSHCALTPVASVSEPGPSSWHTPLLARAHVLKHHIGGGEGGGGEGGGEGGGGEGGWWYRRPQSVQSVPSSHCASVPGIVSVREPAPPSWQ